MTVPAGWYTDPKNAAHLRWWSGEDWTNHIAVSAPPEPVETVRAQHALIAMPATPIRTTPKRSAPSVPPLTGVGVRAELPATAPASRLSPARRRDAPRRPSKRFVTSIVVGAAAILLVSAIANATINSRSGLASVTSDDEPIGFAAVAPTSRSTPAPVSSEEIIAETEAVPFAATEVDDPNLAMGATAVVIAGVNGVRTKSYRITYLDGKQSSRELVSDEITTSPVDQVTAIGSYVTPAAPPAPVVEEPIIQAPVAPPSGGGCDPNYEGACVPIDSDVDCAGGSGNGPSYVQGPVRVVGSDIYGLDSNSDGVGCES